MADQNSPAQDASSAGTTGNPSDTPMGAPSAVLPDRSDLTSGSSVTDLSAPTVPVDDEEGDSNENSSGGSLADLAKKLSSWKDGVMGDISSAASAQPPSAGVSDNSIKNDDSTVGASDGDVGSGSQAASSTVSDDTSLQSASSSPALPVSQPAPNVPGSTDDAIGRPASAPLSFTKPDPVEDIPFEESTAESQEPLPSAQSDSPATDPSINMGESPVASPVPADDAAASYGENKDMEEVSASTQAALSSAKAAMEALEKKPKPAPKPSAEAVGVEPKSKEPELGPWKTGKIDLPASQSQETARKAGRYPYTITELLQTVIEKDASDLHVTVNYPAMIRVDGELYPVGQEIIGEGDINDLVLPVLPENKRELLEVNREVDLAYSFKDDARFRINAFYTKGHVSAAFRLIPNNIRSIDELKLPGVYHQFTQLPQGFVLVTGPTGHGKSTTLAAIVQEINLTYPKHIITIEDPIEYIFPRARALVDQREMHEDTHSWEIALRSAMREDPDVVLVGEMRDFETIQAAITLAETGHLVLATLHTNSAGQTIDRIIDVFPEHQQEQIRTQLSVILEGIVSQRLIPIQQGGRRAASEVLLATGAVRNLIREGKTHQIDNVIRTSLDVGMKTLEHSLVELVREGLITIEDAEAQALHPEEVVRLMRAG